VTWADAGNFTEIPVTWPVGFRARFAPTLEVLTPTGTVVAREGDVLGEGPWRGLFVCTSVNGIAVTRS